MSRVLVALGAFIVATVAIIVIAQNGGQTSNSVPAAVVGNMSTAMANTGMMGSEAGATTRDVKLSILHVQRGCHVWRDGKRQGPMMRLTLPRGGRLSIVDQDVDAHQLVQVAGPRVHMPGPMRMMGRAQLTFMQPGTYRLATTTVDLPGASMTDVPTIGPDNHLRLTVTVA